MARQLTLRELRTAKNLTQKDVSKGAGINRAQYSHYENGIRTPNVHVAKNLAEFFNVKVEEIIFFNNEDTKRHIG